MLRTAARRLSRSGASRALDVTIRHARCSSAIAISATRGCEPAGRIFAPRSHLATRGFAADAGGKSDGSGQNVGSDSSDEEEETKEERMRRRKAEDDEFAAIMSQKLLNAAMKHVKTHGFTDQAIQAGAVEMGLSAAAAGIVKRGAGSLVEHFVDECDSRLSLKIATHGEQELEDLIFPKDKMAKVVGWRLDMLKEHVEAWPAALAVMGKPENMPTTLRQRAMLADELVNASGPVAMNLQGAKAALLLPAGMASAAGFYGDRAAATALYAACELFLVSDTSPGFTDTDAFVKKRVHEMFDLASGVEAAGGFAVRNVRNALNADALPPFVTAELAKAVGGLGKVFGFTGFTPPPPPAGDDKKKDDGQ